MNSAPEEAALCSPPRPRNGLHRACRRAQGWASVRWLYCARTCLPQLHCQGTPPPAPETCPHLCALPEHGAPNPCLTKSSPLPAPSPTSQGRGQHSWPIRTQVALKVKVTNLSQDHSQTSSYPPHKTWQPALNVISLLSSDDWSIQSW